MELGARLRTARVLANLTQSQVSELTGVGRDTISRVESGKHKPMPLTVGKLADAYGLSMAELFDGKPPKSERGLYAKYDIRKRATGEPVEGPTFVLRLDRDPAAVSAMRAYAVDRHCPDELAYDIDRWLCSLGYLGIRGNRTPLTERS